MDGHTTGEEVGGLISLPPNTDTLRLLGAAVILKTRIDFSNKVFAPPPTLFSPQLGLTHIIQNTVFPQLIKS